MELIVFNHLNCNVRKYADGKMGMGEVSHTFFHLICVINKKQNQ
jgi:hypothetical protein